MREADSAQKTRRFCWCPDGSKSHDHASTCPPNPVGPELFDLCGECGCITWTDDWTSWNLDEDTDKLVPAPPNDEGHYYRCPACGYDHRDDDADPGVWGGSLAEMKAERQQLLDEHQDFAEWWAGAAERAAESG